MQLPVFGTRARLASPDPTSGSAIACVVRRLVNIVSLYYYIYMYVCMYQVFSYSHFILFLEFIFCLCAFTRLLFLPLDRGLVCVCVCIEPPPNNSATVSTDGYIIIILTDHPPLWDFNKNNFYRFRFRKYRLQW